MADTNSFKGLPFVAGERMPIRLVQENGDTISLDATSIDMVVEREQSAFGIPLREASKMAIDLNQAMVGFEIQGVFTDDEGQEAASQAKAVIDFHHTQSIFDYEATQAWIEAYVNGPPDKKSTGNKQGLGNNPATMYIGKKRKSTEWLQWHSRHFTLPVAYWIEQNALSTGPPIPITSGLVARFNADALVDTNAVGGILSHGVTVGTWVDSASSLVGNRNGSPIYKEHGANGKPYVYFDGSSRFDISYNANMNPANMTIFAVAQTTNDNGAHQSIISSRESVEGYALYYKMDGSHNEVKIDYYDGSSVNSIESGDDTVALGAPNIVSARIRASSGGKQLYHNGEFKASFGGTYDNSDAATAYIGAGAADGGSYKFVGNIYEIIIYDRILTFDEQEQVEGYLSSKYGIPLIGGLGGQHPYYFFGYQGYSEKIAVVFDAERVAAKNEPYGFVNKYRAMTGLTLASGSTVTAINVAGGDPRDWMDVTNSKAKYHIKIKEPTTYGSFRASAGTDLLLKVTAVGATTITCVVEEGPPGTSISTGDQIWLAPCKNLGSEYESPLYGDSVLVLPIQNAFKEFTSQGETLTYVDYPNYEDGSSRTEGTSQIPSHRSIGGTGKRADEYITYLLSNLLTSTLEISNRAVNADGDKTMDKVFTTAIKKSGDGFETRLEITQVYATSLGTVNNTMTHNFGVGNLPTIQGFTGGSAGKKVKSAGDKVQDLLGILANSNNFDMTPSSSSVGDFVRGFANFTTQVVYGTRDTSDYIYAIQIPYNTKVTKDKNTLDEVVAQRNHWVMTDDAETVEKMSLSNETHASGSYNADLEDSRRNGIHGIITDFHIHRDAEMKAYEFSLKFVSANIII